MKTPIKLLTATLALSVGLLIAPLAANAQAAPRSSVGGCPASIVMIIQRKTSGRSRSLGRRRGLSADASLPADRRQPPQPGSRNLPG